MAIELNREQRNQAVESIERYFAEEHDQCIGNIAADALLGFFLEEIGPLVYNRAVGQVQERSSVPTSVIGEAAADPRLAASAAKS